MSGIDQRDEEMLLRYMDGDLDTDEAAAFQERLEHDEELKAAFEEYSRLDGALAEIRRASAMVDEHTFLAGVRARLDRETSPESTSLWERIFGGWRGFAWGTAVGVAATALVLLVVLPGARNPGSQVPGTKNIVPKGTNVASRNGSDVANGPATGAAPSIGAQNPVMAAPSAAKPVPDSAVALSAGAEHEKSYEILSISSEYTFTQYPVEDDSGYEVLVVFVSYEPDPGKAI